MGQKRLFAMIFSLIVVSVGLTQETEVFAPFVSHLEGEIRNNLIRLSWKDARDVRGPVYVYRSESPFSDLETFPEPKEVAYGTGSYLDEAEKPGILYYFVVASDEEGRKYQVSIPYANILSVSVDPENALDFVHDYNPPDLPSRKIYPDSSEELVAAAEEEIAGIPVFSTARHGLRELPLPALGGSSYPLNSAETRQGRIPRQSLQEITILSGDLTGEDKLSAIVQGSFSKKEWDNAEKEFRRFLELNQTKNDRQKARFYLGQVYYFQGKPKEALFEFLSVEENYPRESNSWIQAVLTAL